ncbi:MAG: glycosyltransferase [Pseudomonadota bacterium]
MSAPPKKRQYHVVFASPIDIEKTRADAAAGRAPRHFMIALADALDARIWTPTRGAAPLRPVFADRIIGNQPASIALAEQVVAAAGDGDLIFCNSEGASLAVAGQLLAVGKKTALAAFGHNLLRPRMTALRLATGIFQRHDAIFTVTPLLASMLNDTFKGRPSVHFVREQTDDAFFSPGEASEKQRSLIMGVGLEQRDYKTLAAATQDMDADIKISAFSKDAAAVSRALPDVLPDNMDQRFYEWPALVQLYRDADIVIAPVFENNYAAGITTILEGMASGKPVIASRSRGLQNIFSDNNAVAWVPPGDAHVLRSAITRLLDSSEERRALAARGSAVFKKDHTFDGQAGALAKRLREIAPA